MEGVSGASSQDVPNILSCYYFALLHHFICLLYVMYYLIILSVFHACYVCSLLAVCEDQQRSRQRLVQVGVKQGGNKVCVCLSACLCVCVSVCLSVYLSICLFVSPYSFVVAVEMLVSDCW